MKKTHSANIGGTVFQVEEDAYEQLQAYLHSIEAHFRSYPDVADILADIEGRIAEQLLQRESAPQVVRMIDVERVIAVMGHTDQFAEAAQEHEPRPGSARRLFRDPDHRVIAGVAAGLASYLGVPRLFVRLTLVLLLFFFGTALVVYLLLWALVPMASSTTDRLQMRGRPVTLASIDQGVRDGIASFPPSARNLATRGVDAAGSLIHLGVLTIARALRWVAGACVVGSATLGVLLLTVVLVVALVNAGAPPLHPDVAAFLETFGTWQQAFKVLLFLLAAIPLTLVIITGLRLFWGVKHLNTRGLAGLLGVWVVALLATAVIWSGSYPQISRFWDDHPVISQARDALDRYRDLFATTAPLTDQQSQALLGTLAAEQRLKQPRDDWIWMYPPGASGMLEYEQERLVEQQESNQRIVDSARTYLDADQLALMQDAMDRRIARAQSRLQARRARIEGRVEVE